MKPKPPLRVEELAKLGLWGRGTARAKKRPSRSEPPKEALFWTSEDLVNALAEPEPEPAPEPRQVQAREILAGLPPGTNRLTKATTLRDRLGIGLMEAIRLVAELG